MDKTKFSANKYIAENRTGRSGVPMTRKIICADGLEFSMQASRFHCCIPRNDEGPYQCVEIGYPSQVIPEFMEYIVDPDANPLTTVYACVPVRVVEQVVDNPGGLKGPAGRTEAA